MVQIYHTIKKLKGHRTDISKAIDETIKEYIPKGLEFFKNPKKSNQYNIIYSDKHKNRIAFDGQISGRDLHMSQLHFKLMDEDYFDWAIDVSKKVEKKTGLEVILETQYKQ